MATTFFLVRHAAHALLDRVLVGRMPDVRLGEPGREQARRLGRRLAGESLNAIYSSPRERCRETADAIAQTCGLPVAIAPDFDEIDVGEWTGCAFSALQNDARWQAWNTARSSTRCPGGESMPEVEARAVRGLATLQESASDGRIAIVSHSDVIKAIILHHLGLSSDDFGRIEVGPASISTLIVGSWGAKLHSLNETVAA